MSKINDGGPAFPADESHGLNNGMPGMTLRDYFAAKAMQGICAHPDNWGLLTYGIAEKAYAIADEMLRAREQS